MTLFKENDIVYFKKEFRSHYTSGYYYHKLNQPYKVINRKDYLKILANNLPGDYFSIQNLEDNKIHFAHSEMIKCLISESDWKLLNRQNNLNEILKNI